MELKLAAANMRKHSSILLMPFNVNIPCPLFGLDVCGLVSRGTWCCPLCVSLTWRAPPPQQQHQSIAVCVILLSVTEYMQSVYSDFFVL